MFIWLIALEGKQKNEVRCWFSTMLDWNKQYILWQTSHAYTIKYMAQYGLFIDAVFPYIPSYIHGNKARICKV